MTSGSGTWTLGERLRRDWPWVAVVLVVLVTAAVLVVAKLSDEEYSTQVGQIVYGQGEVTGYHGYLELPPGRLTIVVSTPRSSLASDGNGTRPAPEGGSFVGVDVTLSARHVVPGTASASVPSPRLYLEAGRHTYPVSSDPLDGPSADYQISSRGDAWVAVAGSPTDVRVAVDYDGVRQVLDPRTGRREAGRAEVLYRHTPADDTKDESCGAATLTAGYRPVRFSGRLKCTASSSGLVPYIAGIGWAPAGKEWLAVSAVTGRSVTLAGPGDKYSDLYTSVDGDVTASLRLDGQASRGDPDTNLVWRLPGYVPTADAQAGFFAVDADPARDRSITVTVTYHRLANDRRPAAGAPVEPTVSATWTVVVSP